MLRVRPEATKTIDSTGPPGTSQKEWVPVSTLFKHQLIRTHTTSATWPFYEDGNSLWGLLPNTLESLQLWLSAEKPLNKSQASICLFDNYSR